MIYKMLKRYLGAANQYRECKEEMRMLGEQTKWQEMLLPLWIDQLLKQLGEEKGKHRKVEDKPELIIIQAAIPLYSVKICKLILSLEDWNGDIWEDPNQELSNDSQLDEWEFEVALLVKTKLCARPQGDNQENTVRITQRGPLQLANLQEK